MAYTAESREYKHEGLRLINAALSHVYQQASELKLNTQSKHPLVEAAGILSRIRSQFRRELGKKVA